MLAVEGPISNDFTSVSIRWRDGAYYMIVESKPSQRSKIMLTPPTGETDWHVKLLAPEGQRIARKDAKLQKSGLENPSADSRVAWSRLFAKAVPSLPALLAEAADFKVRAVPEEKRVVFFLERTAYGAAWITFTVDPSGKFVPLDRGF
ncbi:MAG: hypothetical protein IT363_00905 [Methanoregulaceae archaeon]|nr:hypothetical protein [Methanoregulaceae archaeon]